MDIWKSATLLSAAVGQTLFVGFYMTLPWWGTFLGRALFFEALALMVLIDVGLVGLALEWPGEKATIIGLYGLVSLGIWGRFVAFLLQGRRSHDRD